MHGKSEKISPADPARRLVIEWTAQLPAARRSPGRTVTPSAADAADTKEGTHCR
jgi:hypothetical protein